jgi:plastocyanin
MIEPILTSSRRTFVVVLALYAAGAAPLAAATVPVQLGGVHLDNFVPRDVTVLVGDSVQWTRLSGFHNASADDGTFHCSDACGASPIGNVSSSWASIAFQFTEPDFEPYHCEAHGAPGGFGMSGTVTVLRAIFADGFEDGGSTPEEWVPIVAVGDTCANPINVGGGWNTQDQLAGANNDLDLTANVLCGGLAAHGRDRVYRVDSPGNDIVATVTPLDLGFDPVLYILDEVGGCPTTANLSCSDFSNSGGPGDEETLNLNVAGAHTYYIVVDTLSPFSAGSSYTINISLVP